MDLANLHSQKAQTPNAMAKRVRQCALAHPPQPPPTKKYYTSRHPGEAQGRFLNAMAKRVQTCGLAHFPKRDSRWMFADSPFLASLFRVWELSHLMLPASMSDGYRPCPLSTKNEAHAFTHQLFLMWGPEGLLDGVHNLISITTDWGTESGISKCAAPLWQLCPHAVKTSVQDEDVSIHAEADAAEADVDYTRSLPVPGTLHILHNICQDVTDSLSGFAETKTKLRWLAALLTKAYLRLDCKQ